MDDNDSDPNASLFPLFNFDALKQGFPNNPVNITFAESLLKPPQDITIARTPVVPEVVTPQAANKKRGRKSSKKSVDSKSSLATIKEILEDDQAGVPMLTDAKMKEEKLKKMREGKAKKREQRAEGLIQSIEPQKVFEQLTEVMPSVGGKPQALLGFESGLEDKSEMPGMRIVFKDGKPVLEDNELMDWMNKDRKDKLTLVDESKTQRLTSMSFRKKNHTKQWSPEETRKLYKAVEIFGSDFSLMTKLFPERDRAQIKNKLRKEEKENPKKVEEAFKVHEMSNKKSLMSRIEDFGRKQIKPETENDKFPSLESLTNPDTLNPQNRTTSTCSLDSMDLSILNDLKAILTQESQPRTNDILGLQDKLKKESPDKDKVKKEITLNMGFTQSPKNKSDIKAETEQATIEFQEGKKNNLFMNMLNRQQTNI